MGVFLPTAAVGNGRVLATLGAAGEIMAFFYPRIDFAQNVRQLLSALYVGEPGHGTFLWTFDMRFRRHQWYEDQARVLNTELRLEHEQLRIVFTDFCPPDSHALVRRVRIEAPADRGFRGTLLKYFELRIHEVTGKQSVSYSAPDGIMVQYFRDIALAIGGRRPDVWRCGKSIDEGPRSAKSDLYDGHLNGQVEDIGQVDFALGWHIALEPGEVSEFDILLTGAHDRHEAMRRVKDLAAIGSATLLARTVDEDRQWLESGRRPVVEPRFEQAYDRALLSIRMLQDLRTSAIIAAPEFDPSYELCGGYGYCWPRDATEAVEALRLAGHDDNLCGLCDWYIRAQLPSGQWGQRYWADNQLASSWALREDFLQVDQTAAALIALCEDPPTPEGAPGSEARWLSIRRGAQALAAMVDERGWHSFACDLWETFCGTFTYTNAAIYAALKASARVARHMGEAEIADEWDSVSARIKQATIGLHNGAYFARGLLGDDSPDLVVDSSTLGVSEPFGMISPYDPYERRLIETNLNTIEERLSYRLDDGGVGIRRYEGDGYLGGVIGCVNTLWFALVNLQVALACAAEDRDHATDLRRRAVGYIDFCLAHTTPTGLLPELIGTRPEYPYWAAPHGWASGLMIKCLLFLSELDELLPGTPRQVVSETQTN